MTEKEELDNLTSSIQKECHNMAWQLKDQAPDTFAKTESQDITNVFLFRKLAEYELRLQKLESTNTI